MFYYLGVSDQFKNIRIDDLWTLIPWERRTDSPRNECWFAEDGRNYTYGKGRGVRTYDSQIKSLLDSPQWFIDIWARAEVLTKAKYQGCFINGYSDGSDHLGWHSDDGPDIDASNPICVVTFGAERFIWLRPIMDSIPEADQVKVQKLEHGSIFVMEGGCQQAYQHRIPKAGYVCGPRISFTFRGLV